MQDSTIEVQMSARSDIDQDAGMRIRIVGSRVSLGYILGILAIHIQAGDDYLLFFWEIIWHLRSQHFRQTT